MFSRIIIYYNDLGGYRLINVPIRYKSYRNNLKRFNNEFKLENSISRAKRIIYDYAINNDFKYFVTLTFGDTFDDYNVEMVRIKTQQLIRDMRKKYDGDFQFLLIPEQHKKGDWHLHGFFTADFGQDFYLNEHKYLSWYSFDKYGFSSIDKIRDYKRCCKYITKYVNKDFAQVGKSKHLYFCSKGLKKSQKYCDIVCSDLNIDYDFITDYVSIKDFEQSDLDYILNIIDNSFINYYNNVTSVDN